MAIIKWTPMIEPFEEMERFIEDSMPTGFTPAIDVYETKNDVVIEAPLPGVDPNNVSISIENDTLTIKGEAKKEREVEEKNYYRKEVRSGSFFRSVTLPAHVISDKANADFAKGVLRITVPKTKEEKPKTIKINVKDNK